MYFAHGHQAGEDPSLKSERGRVFYHDGLMDVEDILKQQLEGNAEFQEEGRLTQTDRSTRGRLLVAGI